jgi:hypothetical protein
LDLCQKAEAQFTANNDPDKETLLRHVVEEASASKYMFSPRTTLRLLMIIKNRPYYDDCLVLDTSFSPNVQVWGNAGDLFELDGAPIQQ